jgi:hypothetical protein
LFCFSIVFVIDAFFHQMVRLLHGKAPAKQSSQEKVAMAMGISHCMGR